MVTLLTLHLLGTLDGAFSGFRAMAGRCARIRRNRVTLHALAWGALWAQVALVTVEGAGLLLCLVTTTEPQSLLPAGAIAVRWLGLYAAMVGGAYALRVVPSIDVRAATSVLLFGPLTLLRPVVLVLTAIVVCWTDPRPVMLGSSLAVLVGALSLDRLLHRKGGRWRDA